MNIDEIYLLRCIEIAKNGLGTAAPNPMVGAVIVHKGKIIGEGFTSPYGGPHAEVNAIHSVEDKTLLKKATLYVTLEPCSHFGKTPPCANLIIDNQLSHVVIGIKDPHQKVAGKGIAKLQAAGIKVTIGVMAGPCKKHHKRFLTFQNKKRPYIILKWAESSDGYLAPDPSKRTAKPEPFWITNAYARQTVHQWRSEEQGILVGTNTVLLDNPSLTVRDWAGKSPLRIVLDARLDIPHNSKVFNDKAKTLVIHDSNSKGNKIKGVAYQSIDFEKDSIKQLCDILYNHDINSVIIEGGKQTLISFIADDLWDEARIFKGPLNLGSGLKAPLISRGTTTTTTILQDTLTIITND